MKRILLPIFLIAWGIAPACHAQWVDTPEGRREATFGDWRMSGSIGSEDSYTHGSYHSYDYSVISNGSGDKLDGNIFFTYFLSTKLSLGADIYIDKALGLGSAGTSSNTKSNGYGLSINIEPVQNLTLSLSHNWFTTGNTITYSSTLSQLNNDKRNTWRLSFNYGSFK